jgi:hypothetical protein
MIGEISGQPLASSRSTRMFCNSDSWDSAICRSPEPCSRPLVMEAFYLLYSPFPLFTQVRGSGILRSWPRMFSCAGCMVGTFLELDETTTDGGVESGHDHDDQDVLRGPGKDRRD